MKKYLVLFIFMLSIFLISCSDDSGGGASGIGGPERTPEEIEVTADPVDEKSAESVTDKDTDQGESIDTEIPQDEKEPVKDSPSEGDHADKESDREGTEETDTEAPVVSDDDVSDVTAPVEDDKTSLYAVVRLDTSFGRWFATERKELFLKAEYEEVKENISRLETEIREYEKAIAELNLPEQAADRAREARTGNKERKIAENREEITRLISEYGVNRIQDGIHTYWENEILYADVTAPKTGWYRLRVVAKNIDGPLPDYYSYFNLSVTNETTGKPSGGVLVKASDEVYHAGDAYIYLEEGYSRLKLLWTNDAWKDEVYDANINIRKITIDYRGEKAVERGNVRFGNQFSYIGGRFFWEDNTVWTSWDNQTIGFDYTNLQSGKYRITIEAKNYGIVPQEYKDFMVRVNSECGDETYVYIEADSDNYKTGSSEIDIVGPTSIYLTWENDMWRPDRDPVEDANIKYRSVKMERIGESERSALGAYLMGTRSGNMMVTFGSIIIIGLMFSVFYMINKRRSGYSLE